MRQLYCGFDLHSNNVYCGIQDGVDQRVFRRRMPNDINFILKELKPFK
jgi:hypothetical protein